MLSTFLSTYSTNCTPKVYIVEKMQKRITVADTDEGKELAGRIEDLKELLKAYRSGLLKERIR